MHTLPRAARSQIITYDNQRRASDVCDPPLPPPPFHNLCDRNSNQAELSGNRGFGASPAVGQGDKTESRRLKPAKEAFQLAATDYLRRQLTGPAPHTFPSLFDSY